MIVNTEMRKSQAERRIQLRCSAETLTNVISEGTNCSRFEAEVITNKAREVFRLGEYSEDAPLQPGQMVWQAIDAEEPPGKPLAKCKYKRIYLTAHRLSEDLETQGLHGRAAKRGQQISRMCDEAYKQGTLLTVEDLAVILDCDEKTVRRDIKELRERHGVMVSTRGNKCDIGPGMTHREKVLERFIKGEDPLSISYSLNHSLRATERYIQSFCRIVHTQQEVRDSLQTALITGMSSSLVSRCLDIRDRFMKTKAYKKRLEQIEELGSRFWDSEGAKKKAGPSKRRLK